LNVLRTSTCVRVVFRIFRVPPTIGWSKIDFFLGFKTVCTGACIGPAKRPGGRFWRFMGCTGRRQKQRDGCVRLRRRQIRRRPIRPGRADVAAGPRTLAPPQPPVEGEAAANAGGGREDRVGGGGKGSNRGGRKDDADPSSGAGEGPPRKKQEGERAASDRQQHLVVVVVMPRALGPGEPRRVEELCAAGHPRRRDLQAAYSDLGRGGIRPPQLHGSATSSSSVAGRGKGHGRRRPESSGRRRRASTVDLLHLRRPTRPGSPSRPPCPCCRR
jgi:hypothetical protein